MLLDFQDAKRGIGPSTSSLVSSVALHAALIGWMFFGPSLGGRPAPPPKNIYQQLIEPNEKKLVWYNFRDKLPQVSPLERHGMSRPPRTDRKTDQQTIVSNPQGASKSKQMVYLPAPPRELDHEVPAPNLFAFAVPRLAPPPPKPAAKLFAPPPEVMRALVPPEPLPDAPDVAGSTAKVDLPQADALARPQPKEFVAPREAKRALVPAPPVPDAPKVAPTSAKLNLPQPDALPKPQPKTFVPPPELKRAPGPAPAVPDAPSVAPASAKLNLPQPDGLPKPQPKTFVPPREAKRASAPAPVVPDAPSVAPASAKLNLPQPDGLPRPQPKTFVPPREAKRAPAPAPSVPESPKVAATSAKLNLPQPDALPKPRPKTFVPPREAKRAAGPAPMVPDPPKVTTTAKLTLPPPEALPKPKPKLFIPPREAQRSPGPTPPVPDAPKVGATSARVDLPQTGALPKPQPKTFVPPPEARRTAGPALSVPDAPAVGPTSARVDLPQTGALPKPQPKTFVPPREVRHDSGPAPSVPDAPAVGTASARFDLPRPGALPRPQPREFTPPSGSKPSPGTPAALPEAPQVAGTGGRGIPPRSFIPPADPFRTSADLPEIAEAPALDASATSGSLTAAIVGLKPADQLTELPDAAHSAQFSSGPKLMEDGGKGEPVETAKLFVPDLMIRDGAISAPDATLVKKMVKAAAAPTSAENLAEVSRSTPLLRSEARLPGVSQVPSAPDPRLSGRIVYMVAIQMPNVTSYIGSWTMWFADREPMPGQVREMRPPVPTHKVDPKYVASAAAERVEGKVQLSAVIRKDGHVDSIAILQHLDDRLDFSATQALQKWEFEPARRDGHTVDVDAIFEIPFRLEPLATR